MNKRIPVMIRDKIAHAPDGYQYICGNSDFTIVFDFDEEWNEFDFKTARFTYNGMHQDVVFSGGECRVPIISDTFSFRVGVFAGNLRTTTAAYVPAKKGILCDAGRPAPPTEDVYSQIMAKLNELDADVPPEAIEAAVNKYLEEHPIEGGGIDEEQLDKAVQAALKEAKESGEFDGAPGKDGADGQDGEPGKDGVDGKSAYQYAKDGGYTGTEAEFAAKLAQEIPEAYTLPTASADVKGGVKVGDGLQMDGDALGVKPEGKYELIDTITLNGESAITLTQEPDGTTYNFTNILVEIETSDKSDVTGHIYPNIYCGGDAVAAYGLGSAIAVGSRRYMVTGVSLTKGIAETFATSVGHDWSSATTLYRRPLTSFANKPINKVYVSASVPFPDGTMIRIKAVRA